MTDFNKISQRKMRKAKFSGIFIEKKAKTFGKVSIFISFFDIISRILYNCINTFKKLLKGRKK
ncbi:hypothetical protein CPZ25_000385 [Eubacterium maltosivorans]|uniref:Uncharacterized protein n=1 Tax=Eubacterium maltosivorans TaxID=2041044 RepID=A0A4P9C5B4_EUBML|nr:hypothetical protein CPZ25_000385 [Eubacterium maltosivorans]